MSVAGGPWTVTVASVRGSQHERTGLPNQDAAAVYRVSLPEGLVAAVADGHGGARYVRSAVGANLAVQIACAVGARFSPEVAAAAGDEGRLLKVARKIADQLVASWRADVLAHLGSQPFTDEERARADQDLDDEPVVAYGATLLCAIALRATLVVLQLGDGDVLVLDSDNGVGRSPVPGDERLVGNATTSLCLPDAARDIRVAVVDGEESMPELVVLSSDGYGNSFADTDWRSSVAADLRAQLLDGGHEHLEESLPGWLQESAAAGGDDVTVAVLSRDASVAAETGEATLPGGIPVGGGLLLDGSGQRPAPVRRPGWLIVALVFASFGLGVAASLVALSLSGRAAQTEPGDDTPGADFAPGLPARPAPNFQIPGPMPAAPEPETGEEATSSPCDAQCPPHLDGGSRIAAGLPSPPRWGHESG